MNLQVDGLIAVLVLLAAWRGSQRSFAGALLTLSIFAVGFVCAWAFPDALYLRLRAAGVPAVWARAGSPIAVVGGVVLVGAGLRRAISWLCTPSPRPSSEDGTEEGAAESEARERPVSWAAAALFGTVALVYGLMLAYVVELQPVSPRWSALARESWSFRHVVSPLLDQATVPAPLAPLKLAKAVRDNPENLKRLRDDEQLQTIANHPKVRALADDRALQEAARARDIQAIWNHPAVQDLFDDEELARLIGELDVPAILRRLEEPPQ